MYRTIYSCIDCGKNLSYQGEKSKGKRCHSCSAKWLVLHNPRFCKDGFKKGNKYGKRFYKGQSATKGSFKQGHPVSFEVRWKCRLANLGKRRSIVTEFKPTGRAQIYKRCKHITDTKYNNWRKAVYHKNNWTCQRCGQRGGELQAHHIKSWVDYPELRYSLRNGITLHKKCHIELHHPPEHINFI